jgi:hypothetical protein
MDRNIVRPIFTLDRRKRRRRFFALFLLTVILTIGAALWLRVLQQPHTQSYDMVIEESTFVVHAVEMTYGVQGRELTCTLIVPDSSQDKVAVCEPRDVYSLKKWLIAGLIVLSSMYGAFFSWFVASRRYGN